MKISIRNRKAFYCFVLFDKYTAGIQLLGSEIKSIRLRKANFTDSYCVFKEGELWIKNFKIAPYIFSNRANHKEDRERKLLLNRKELNKLQRKKREGALTIVPIKLFINSKGLAKVEIALAKGKKIYDKRDEIRKKDLDRKSTRLNSSH